MLKKLGYNGAYNDQNISVNVLLENPVDCGLEETNLVFSIRLRGKKESAAIVKIQEFRFYIMDETNCLHNTRIMLCPTGIAETTVDDEPMRQPDGLILADFKHSFLFQDLRIAFYYQPYRRIIIIGLEH